MGQDELSRLWLKNAGPNKRTSFVSWFRSTTTPRSILRHSSTPLSVGFLILVGGVSSLPDLTLISRHLPRRSSFIGAFYISALNHFLSSLTLPLFPLATLTERVNVGTSRSIPLQQLYSAFRTDVYSNGSVSESWSTHVFTCFALWATTNHFLLLPATQR